MIPSEEALLAQCSKDLQFLNGVANKIFGNLLVVSGILIKLTDEQLNQVQSQLENNRAGMLTLLSTMLSLLGPYTHVLQIINNFYLSTFQTIASTKVSTHMA